MDRRVFLRRSMETGAVALAVSAGLLRPVTALGAGFGGAFDFSSSDEVLVALLQGAEATTSDRVTVKAPEIAENGAKVPVEVETDLAGVESISLVVPKNPKPLIAAYLPGESYAGMVNTRIKMAETSDVVALVRTPAGVFTNKVMVKVTMGGCGG